MQTGGAKVVGQASWLEEEKHLMEASVAPNKSQADFWRETQVEKYFHSFKLYFHHQKKWKLRSGRDKMAEEKHIFSHEYIFSHEHTKKTAAQPFI